MSQLLKNFHKNKTTFGIGFITQTRYVKCNTDEVIFIDTEEGSLSEERKANEAAFTEQYQKKEPADE